MSTIKVFIKSHSLSTYFILAFAITWGGVFLAGGGPGGFPENKEQFVSLLPLFIPALLAGPSVAGTLLTALTSGRAGFRDLISRLSRWQAGIGWYAVALLTAPLVLTVELFVLSLFSPGFLPGIFVSEDKVSLLVMGIVAGLMVGFFEELGWTGFATPQLRLRYNVLTTGLIVGVLWGAWHIFLNAIWASGAYSGGVPPAIFIAARGIGDLIGLLPAYRILTVWVYEHTESLLVVMLMHASLTASTMIVEPAGISGRHLLIYDLVSTFAMWLIVAAVLVATGGHLERVRSGRNTNNTDTH